MKKSEGARRIWNRYKYAALVILAGAGLLLWPGSGRLTSPPSRAEEEEAQDLQTELESILGAMSGVGEVRVLLTVDSDGERKLAQDTDLDYSGDTASPEDYSRRSSTVLVGGGSEQKAVVVRTMYPTYRGALVVCQGGGNPAVQLAVTQAVSALTGLPTDRVTVAKCQ